jgi:subtilisin family serine protease
MKSLMRPIRMLVCLAAAALATVATAETRLICRLADGADPAAIATKYGVTLRDFTPSAPFALYGVTGRVNLNTLRKKMTRDPLVIWTEDDAEIVVPENQANKGTTIPAIGDSVSVSELNPGMLAQIRFDSTIAALPGREVRLAILDTGLAQNQLALWAKTVASVNVMEPGLPAYDQALLQDSNGNGRRDEAVGHGTMVAALADLVGPQVKFVIARVADSDGNATAWSLAKGLAFAVVNGAEIANVSLGSEDGIVALHDVMDWCTEERNLLVVAPIGNDGKRMALEPSGITKVLCVTGVTGDDRKASFSNWEGDADASAPAVGNAVRRLDGTFEVWSGTSFAAPLVAGAVADCLRRTTPRSADTLHEIVSNSGDLIDGLNPAYRDRLGRRLNYVRLDSMLRNVGP